LRQLLLLVSIAASSALGCAVVPPPPSALTLAPISADERAQQTRVYATEDRTALLGACVAVLRRHGFAAEDQDAELGVIVAAKDATDGRERTRLRASLAAAPTGEFGLETSLRLTLQRLAWNARGRETKREAVREGGEYAGFFDEVARELGVLRPGAE